jgi:DNA-binding transcriptional LysR family regulator
MPSKTYLALCLCFMSMDLRVLRYFVTTVDEGSATRAAATLHVTQPVLSRQLRQLEHQTGLRLFERDGRRLRLTHSAEQLLPMARALLRGAGSLEQAARSLASGQVPQLHVAVPTTTLTDVLAPFVATLQPSDPAPLLRSLDPRGAAAAIAAGADLAIVHRPPPAALASRPLAVLPVLAYVRRNDAWADRGSVDLADLVGRPLILMRDDFRPRVLLDRAVDAAELAYGEILECTNAQVAQALAAAGRGVAVVSDDPRFDLVPLAIVGLEGPVQIRLYAAWDRHHHASETIAALAERLGAFCVERYGPGVSPG